MYSIADWLVLDTPGVMIELVRQHGGHIQVCYCGIPFIHLNHSQCCKLIIIKY